jgi:phosphopantothenoylcysteine decarboxylase
MSLIRNWANSLLIAPLSANTLAKISNGLCDNLLTCIVRAWDYEKKFVVAPAMNTYMYENEFTGK